MYAVLFDSHDDVVVGNSDGPLPPPGLVADFRGQGAAASMRLHIQRKDRDLIDYNSIAASGSSNARAPARP